MCGANICHRRKWGRARIPSESGRGAIEHRGGPPESGGADMERTYLGGLFGGFKGGEVSRGSAAVSRRSAIAQCGRSASNSGGCRPLGLLSPYHARQRPPAAAVFFSPCVCRCVLPCPGRTRPLPAPPPVPRSPLPPAPPVPTLTSRSCLFRPLQRSEACCAARSPRRPRCGLAEVWVAVGAAPWNKGLFQAVYSPLCRGTVAPPALRGPKGF